MTLQKLTLLWMLEEKGKAEERKKGKLAPKDKRKIKIKKRRSPTQGPEARKPRSSWRKPLLTIRFGSVVTSTIWL